jgi:hypothetical protein
LPGARALKKKPGGSGGAAAAVVAPYNGRPFFNELKSSKENSR